MSLIQEWVGYLKGWLEAVSEGDTGCGVPRLIKFTKRPPSNGTLVRSGYEKARGNGFPRALN
ncbi:MAG: hypothetical protein ACI9NC_001088 [Verrucomicrobiales bacterium]|jgi:hypothetical protein